LLLGAAGTVLSLLALQSCRPAPELLERAVWCGEHLLAHQVESPTGGRAWRTLNQGLLTGFSHGAAGIAYALFRLYQATGISRFHTAAVDAVRYEQSVFSGEAGNWPDLRKGGSPEAAPRFLNTWCHGAPGIALARIGSLAAHDAPDIRQDIAVALDSARRTSLEQVDHLCCGNLGIVDVLLTAGLRLARPELVREAHQRAAWVLRRAQESGSFRLIDNRADGVLNAGFFQGTAGIGYQLLRLAHPAELPSVLLWE
jgi:lantibiotic modifying enzyme